MAENLKVNGNVKGSDHDLDGIHDSKKKKVYKTNILDVVTRQR